MLLDALEQVQNDVAMVRDCRAMQRAMACAGSFETAAGLVEGITAGTIREDASDFAAA